MSIIFHRGVTAPIQALSFDLDDTLYQNEEIILKAEHAQLDAVCQRIPEASALGLKFWRDVKWQVAKAEPDCIDDVTLWRHKVIRAGLEHLGVTGEQQERWAEEIYQQFYIARSDFQVPSKTFEILSELTQRFPLVAVTNGNVDIDVIGLSDYFVGYYRAGEQGCRRKPYSDMLDLAAKHLDLPPQNILHLGDNLGSDVLSARRAGCQAWWFNPEKTKYAYGSLADAEYSDLADLLHLL